MNTQKMEFWNDEPTFRYFSIIYNCINYFRIFVNISHKQFTGLSLSLYDNVHYKSSILNHLITEKSLPWKLGEPVIEWFKAWTWLNVKSRQHRPILKRFSYHCAVLSLIKVSCTNQWSMWHAQSSVKKELRLLLKSANKQNYLIV